MRIALVRHLKVNANKPARFMTSEEFREWVDHYNQAKIITSGLGKTGQWDCCYSSDMPRAMLTAAQLYDDEMIETPLLQEVPLEPFVNTDKRLPFMLWNVGGRLAWYTSHRSQPEARRATIQRAEKFIELLESSGKKNILVVSHGFFLIVLAKKLAKLGYSGRKVKRFQHGELIIYEKLMCNGVKFESECEDGKGINNGD